jgi:hypothetical protein
MAHWAELDENNIVLRVTVGDNNDPAGDEGYSWLIRNLGGRWIQTSYNANFRNKFAGIGDLYLEEYDVFVFPQPYESWSLNYETFKWEAPVEYPQDGQFYIWDEDSLSWILAISDV